MWTKCVSLRATLTSLGKELHIAQMPELGIMVETPAAAMLADRFAAVADFFSIGSNDLTQYILAIDRGHPALGRNLDGLHPAVLRAISVTVEGASMHKRWVGICGALARFGTRSSSLLIGLGLSELSVSIPMVPKIKAQVRALDFAACRKLAERARSGLADRLLDAFGGIANVQKAEHAAVTRLRFVLRDGGKADNEALKRSGVAGFVRMSDSVWHVIAGHQAAAVAAAVGSKLDRR